VIQAGRSPKRIFPYRVGDLRRLFSDTIIAANATNLALPGATEIRAPIPVDGG